MGATSTKGEEGGWPHTHDTAMYHNIVLEVLSLQTTEKVKEKENAEIFFSNHENKINYAPSSSSNKNH